MENIELGKAENSRKAKNLMEGKELDGKQKTR